MYDVEKIKNSIICGDTLIELKKFPDNSIDTILTDPPYGIGFMGKEWDNFNPTAVKEATEKSGRKKSYLNPNRSKGARAGASPSLEAGRYDRSLQGQIGFQNWMTEVAKELLRVTKPGGTMMIFGGTRTYHRLACAIEDAGWIIKDCIMWIYGSGFPKATDISKQMDKMAGKKPKIIGRNPNSREKSGKENTLYESGTVGKTDYITEPTTEMGKLWSGWKSHGLKPAYEPILVAMKPNEGSYAQNALKHGVAGLNIDGGRIGTKKMGGGTMPDLRDVGRMSKEAIGIDKLSFGQTSNAKRKECNTEATGRFPANIILDEEAAKLLPNEASRFFKVIK